MPKLGSNFVNPKVLKSLGNCKIYSVNDFLQAHFEKLETTLNAEEVIEATYKLISNYSAQPKEGYSLYQYLLRKTNIIQTYIKGLDELLNGGLLTGTILEMCGMSGSGKTQICLTITLNIVLEMKSNVTYIDTKRDLCSSRFLQILHTRTYKEESLEPDTVLERINVILVDDVYKLITMLQSMKNGLQNNVKLGKVIIIDSLAVLFFPFIGLPTCQGLSLLNHVASLLKMIAVEQQVAIILTNFGNKFEDNVDILRFEEKQKVTDFDIRPALGKYWLHVPNTRLIINRINTARSERVLIVKKSDYIKIGNMCTVEILNSGVR